MNIVYGKREQASQSGWRGLHMNIAHLHTWN